MECGNKDPGKEPTTDDEKTLVHTPKPAVPMPSIDELSSDEDLFEFLREIPNVNRNEPLGSPSNQRISICIRDIEMPISSSSFTISSSAASSEFAKLLMRLGGEEGDGDANQIVIELLNSKKQAERATSVTERVSENLLLVLRSQTLAEAGIITGNERYRSFKCVLQNYAKLYAAKRFIEKLPMLGLSPQSQSQSQLQSSVQSQFLFPLQPQAHEIKNNDDQNKQTQALTRMVADEVLQIPELLRQLWDSLEKMEFFNEDTAYKVYLEARRHPQAKILRELMLTRISRVYLCIVSSASFLDFSEHELIHMLNNCYLSVNSEIEIFLSVILWLEHNWYERKNCAERVLGGVRFGLMPTWYLHTLDRTNRCSHFARVIACAGVKAVLEKGLDDALALRSKHLRNSNLSDPESPLPRDWVADPECGHHHKCHCERFVYPTYDVFKDYLARIISCAPNYWRTLRPAQEVYRKELKCCVSPYQSSRRN
ncbi:uncharacterized protein LOC133848454 [Drosophila sulfurigaster albostrigata]|uniref:uncharacterized protein LOC133848454 n=1 Tax=Drosophila sulfurigaster albostrigata TaxID=89887 RepID=UPI002D21D3E0|nr:uncharacterized protein LOC133848454 [Drosophila sulfurigaster albostrigata]